MIYFWIIFFLLLLLYFILILYFSISWKKNASFYPTPDFQYNNNKISVIIAVRNEEQNIPSLISSLSQQTLPSNLFEVIIVNDHSTDNTTKELARLSEEHTWLSTINLSKSKFGKKEALKLGISEANGELLAFTDGDCVLPKTWLSTLSQFYTSANYPDFIIGMVDQTADSLLQDVFRLEFLSLVLSAAGAAALGRPILCNGANMAIKASAMKTYSQNTVIASGDDVFLLHFIKKNGGRIKLLKSHQHLVSTGSPEDISSFIEQRKRWVGKSTNYRDYDTIIVALIVFSTSLALTTSFFLGIYFKRSNLILIGFAVKGLADFILFQKGIDLYRFSKQLWLLPLISVIYPFYITITTLYAIKKPFTWKGRKYSK